YSAYGNDAWRLSNHLSLNIGARIDLNRSKDQSGTAVVRDSQWSPRAGMTWDMKGDGRWTANVGFARYVAGISTALVDAGSAGGRYRWARMQIGANYTLSKTWGNFNGENVGSGPIRASFDTFPEYRQESWNYPTGYNPGDQRHKVRTWVVYALPLHEAAGHVD